MKLDEALDSLEATKRRLNDAEFELDKAKRDLAVKQKDAERLVTSYGKSVLFGDNVYFIDNGLQVKKFEGTILEKPTGSKP